MEIQEIISSSSNAVKPESYESSGGINEKDNSFNDHLDRASGDDDDWDIAAKKSEDARESEQSRSNEDEAVDESEKMSNDDSNEMSDQEATSESNDDSEVETSAAETDDDSSGKEDSFAELSAQVEALPVVGDGSKTVDPENQAPVEGTGEETIQASQLLSGDEGEGSGKSQAEGEKSAAASEKQTTEMNNLAVKNANTKGNAQAVAQQNGAEQVGAEQVVDDNVEEAPSLMESLKKMANKEDSNNSAVKASSQKGDGAGSAMNVTNNTNVTDQSLAGETKVSSNMNESMAGKGGEGKQDNSSLSSLVQKADVAQTDTNKSDQSGFRLVQKGATSEVDKSMTMSKLVSDGTKGEVKITINPPSLGRLQVELSLQDNNVKALFVAESNTVKSILESNMQDFKDSLSDRDVNLESFDVSTGDSGREKDKDEENELLWQNLSHDDSSGVKGEEKYRIYNGTYNDMDMQGLNIFV